MKVLLVDQYADLGGAQRCLIEVAEAVLERGWEIRAALPAGGPLRESFERLGVPVFDIPCGPFSQGRKSARDALRFALQLPQATRLLRRWRPDLYYVNGPRVAPAACLAACGRAPVLFHCHSRIGNFQARLVVACLRLAPAYSIIGGSRFVLAPYSAPSRVVYNGVPDLSWRERPVCRKIGMLGRIAPGKGQREFVEAARALSKDRPGLRFVICGQPMFDDPAALRYFETLRERAAGWPIEFAHRDGSAEDVLASLDLLVVPSVGPESTTRVILEASSAGVPVIAFATGGIPEVVEDRITGILVRPAGAEALAAAMRDLIVHRWSSVPTLTARARYRWQAEFAVARFQRQILEAMEDLTRPLQSAQGGPAEIETPARPHRPGLPRPAEASSSRPRR